MSNTKTVVSTSSSIYTIDKKSISLIKEKVSIQRIATDFGIELKEKGTQLVGTCPFHGCSSSKPSFCISPNKNLFFCFHCKTGGDLFTFLRKLKGFSFVEAFKTLKETFDRDMLNSLKEQKIPPAVVPPSQPSLIEVKKTKRKEGRDYLKGLVETYNLNRKTSLQASQYLSYLGISYEVAEEYLVGFSNNSLLTDFYITPSTTDSLLKKGAISKKRYGFREYLSGCMTIPVTSSTSKKRVTQIYGLPMDSKSVEDNCYMEEKFLPIEHEGIFNLKNIEGRKEIFLADNPLDALSLIELGFKNTTSTFGAGVLTQELISHIYEGVESVFVFTSRFNKAEHIKLSSTLSPLGIKVFSVSLPEDIESINHLLRKRKLTKDPLMTQDIEDEIESLPIKELAPS